ncbi:MAG: hypothetical protein IT494_07420, partial [Gammaproteobacteria bacterium]|nr:hypothetical protein [Gammaproteobacteria bacterium]
EGLPKPALKAALAELLLDGVLRMDVVGKYDNRTPRHGLIEVPDDCTK